MASPLLCDIASENSVLFFISLTNKLLLCNSEDREDGGGRSALSEEVAGMGGGMGKVHNVGEGLLGHGYELSVMRALTIGAYYRGPSVTHISLR